MPQALLHRPAVVTTTAETSTNTPSPGSTIAWATDRHDSQGVTDMGHVTVEQGAQHEAAIAVAGTLISLYLADRREAGLHLIDALDADMAKGVDVVLDSMILSGLLDAVRRRASGQAQPDVASRPSQSWRDRVRDAAEKVLGEHAPGVDIEVLVVDDAFDALVSRVVDRCLDDHDEPVDVLNRLGRRTLAAAENVDSAAAFLAARVRDLPEDPDCD